MNNEEFYAKIEGMLDQIKRENAEQVARLAVRENAQTKWIIGTLLTGIAVMLTLIKLIFFP
jgi:hypothetical protein